MPPRGLPKNVGALRLGKMPVLGDSQLSDSLVAAPAQTPGFNPLALPPIPPAPPPPPPTAQPSIEVEEKDEPELGVAGEEPVTAASPSVPQPAPRVDWPPPAPVPPSAPPSVGVVQSPAAMPVVAAPAAAPAPDPANALAQMVGMLQQQNELMQRQNDALLRRLDALESSQKVTTVKVAEAMAMAGGAPLVAEQDVDLRPLTGRDVAASAESWFYIRLKPYDKSLGHMRRGVSLNELADGAGRPQFLRGGSGRPGDIPQWVRVSKDQALKMSRYRQRDMDPTSPMLLDIVTDRQKEVIDVRESAARAGLLGISGITGRAASQPGAGILNERTQVFQSQSGGVSATAGQDTGMPGARSSARVRDDVGPSDDGQPPAYWEVQRSKMGAAVRKVQEGLGGDVTMGDVSMGGRLPG